MNSIINAFIFFTAILFCACSSSEQKNQRSDKDISGDLIIFHAGSLSVPMKEIANAFKKENPDVNIIIEAAGSVECARKITEIKKPCDIMASADYTVIDKLLIPTYADWNIKFASNEMAIVYTEKSRKSNEINVNNWYEILLDNTIQIGRADPNSDPCGYRTVLVLKLAANFYKIPGLDLQLLEKDKNNIRPKEVDLIALLESGAVDYIFLYRSVAEQHKLKFFTLPDEINLKSPELAEHYAQVSVEINGKKPGEKIIQKGESMVYGITQIKNAPNKKAALAFIKFLLTKEKGMAIMEKMGQPSVIPASTNSYDKIPDELKMFAFGK
ncbi:MAG: molybdate ABC transporter substrate-binding protein [Bacteroidetes bacterium RIFOXYA12_FULL_35_11]|nr:MAG: molybdate ABC transporter substrate-binding protein [Bacteroidetes bacterium GWF2_35_48]OFY79443.1 MAG: molybdate ABC transporter substrate-binding protein [Bacteroidetes bacterium RIFOXYA12_FULL_35_11]OFY93226.1 MAG: molybdate ABC transporter substrate-binding protein [Bacteroidetes bacterium RIFOXYB2_FULL_35_7]OFY96702.1 MAG: molybdate ABC transporter substrate-binding protein [Bacteroidetes bacterium RIFOXYC12_FULL_35_7]HBX51053.1 tungstate ABC transporter substrate-binding protein W